MTKNIVKNVAKEKIGKKKKEIISFDYRLKEIGMLAYTIENKNSGFYNLFQFEAPSEIISTFELEFARDETVMRYLTVALDKHAIAWAEKRKNRKSYYCSMGR